MTNLMTIRNDYYAASEIVEKNASFDGWQEENAVGRVANVCRRRSHGSIISFHQVHNTVVEIGDD